MLGIDTETTGLDLRHGCKPFLITTSDENFNQHCWEWDVDPLTREPIVPKDDLEEFKDTLNKEAKRKINKNNPANLVFHNSRFDIRALETINALSKVAIEKIWSYLVDTQLAGHLINSFYPKTLTYMCKIYLNLNVKPYEDNLREACNQARNQARKNYPDWKIAKKGLDCLPSAKETVWKNDLWLPRAIALEENYPKGECTVVNKNTKKYDIFIGRGTKWGNPFKIGKDGNRSQVIKKYEKYLLSNKVLMNDLHELDGKILGCFCKPEECHGDVLKEQVKELKHPWWDVCSEYANMDSASTVALAKIVLKIIKERKLEKIWKKRLQILPITYKMESVGVSLSERRLVELETQFKKESNESANVCINIAESCNYDLELPKSGNNNSIGKFVFDVLKLPVIKRSERTGNPSLDKNVLENYEETLPRKSKQLCFVRNLTSKRKRDTALSYLESYRKFMIPERIGKNKKLNPCYFRVYPSLNPTGTVTLRWSSNNPNAQQISKQEKVNLRYVFGPSIGREWFSCDAKNIELRLSAYEAGEEEMIQLFECPNDPPYYGSYHLLVFDTLHPKRFEKYGEQCKNVFASTWYQWTKNGNFAVQYGAIESSGTADTAYHVKGAQRIISNRFKDIAKLNQLQIDIANERGYVETIPDKTVDPTKGYPIMCPKNRWGKVLQTVPLNYHIQSTAMWWMMKAMIRCQEWLDDFNSNKPANQQAHMIMQVHDELVFDFPKPKTKDGNIKYLKELQNIMSLGGEDIGIPTPVSLEKHPDNWSKGLAV